MTSQTMTILGTVSAMMAFALVSLPMDTPQYVKVILGIVNSGLIFYLGKSNPGTESGPPVIVEVKQHSDVPTIVKP